MVSRLFRYAFYGRLVFSNTRQCVIAGNCRFSSTPIDFPDMGPPIPKYKEKYGENIETLKARLIYQSRKRGMSENGLLLSNFTATYLQTFDKEQLEDFDRLINKPTNDWDIYYWILEKDDIPEEFNTPVMKMLKEYSKNEAMESRYRQPDLKFDNDSRNV